MGGIVWLYGLVLVYGTHFAKCMDIEPRWEEAGGCACHVGIGELVVLLMTY